MDLTAALVRLGSLLSVLAAAAALSFLVATGPAVSDIPTVGLLATAALLVVALLAAVGWGRRGAPTTRETPYW
ncbi:hypothetical protein [Halobaculum roseum]|uniref:Major facilitator superfamily (MFS) profile domain-containing protein n=1 Tax=Halobaculum roseum TaxID=2175149 RepID=A0ABD5MIU5_9EURY|nr:hypothetical protein [Halobaculum roseum]QZY03030.1 hypothetical protein K6T36_02245 [Halobaculum roseum]